MRLTNPLRGARARIGAVAYRSWYRIPEVSIKQIAPPMPTEPTLILDQMCLPPFFGSATHDDFTPLMRLIHHIQPRLVLEFGTAHGNTTANICANSSARVVTVNALPDQLSGDIVTFALSEREIGYVYRQHGFTDRVTQVYANTLDFHRGQYLDEESVDLAIIDACHDTPYVINDFSKVLPTIRPGGVVLFHDTHPSMAGHLIGSFVACGKLRHKGFDIRHIRGTWWAYWRKPS